MRSARFSIWLRLTTVVLLMALPAIVLADEEVKLEAMLTGTDAAPDASGGARFEMRPDRSEFRVEVEDVASVDMVNVLANGDFIGTITLDAGRGELELQSQNGDTVPVLKDGDEIEVVNAADDTLLLVGTLRPS